MVSLASSARLRDSSVSRFAASSCFLRTSISFSSCFWRFCVSWPVLLLELLGLFALSFLRALDLALGVLAGLFHVGGRLGLYALDLFSRFLLRAFDLLVRPHLGRFDLRFGRELRLAGLLFLLRLDAIELLAVRFLYVGQLFTPSLLGLRELRLVLALQPVDGGLVRLRRLRQLFCAVVELLGDLAARRS